MKKAISTENDDVDSGAEKTKTYTPNRMSNHELVNTSSNSVTSEEIDCQIKAVDDLLTTGASLRANKRNQRQAVWYT